MKKLISILVVGLSITSCGGARAPDSLIATRANNIDLLTTACGEGNGNTITATWDRPTTYTDDTPLDVSQISGYVIYYGVQPGSYTTEIDIQDANTNNCVISNLPGDVTYYIVVTVKTIDGKQSNYSNEIVRRL